MPNLFWVEVGYAISFNVNYLFAYASLYSNPKMRSIVLIVFTYTMYDKPLQ